MKELKGLSSRLNYHINYGREFSCPQGSVGGNKASMGPSMTGDVAISINLGSLTLQNKGQNSLGPRISTAPPTLNRGHWYIF